MVWYDILWLLAVFLNQVLGVNLPSSHVVHEKRDIELERWVKRDRCHPDKLLPMRVGLVQSNLDQAHDYLMDVYAMADLTRLNEALNLHFQIGSHVFELCQVLDC